ncbi:MAG: inorganic phosphate transporter [Hyphomicrobiaceae bacterium]
MAIDSETQSKTAQVAPKRSLDKDLRKIGRLETATRSLSRSLMGPSLAIAFLALSAFQGVLHVGSASNTLLVVIAAVLAGYMALNIGANDVANNVGPAVGSKALTMTGALIIAAIFEASGALLAGGDVVSTISKGIVDPTVVGSASVFIGVMMAAMVSSAIWVNLATVIGAPVSTTHAVVGGVIGAGIAAVGVHAINWPVMAAIVASWVVSPLLGGVIAAAFLAFVKHFIIYRDDKIAAARTWVPALLSVMAAAFTLYLMMKGLSKIWKPSLAIKLTLSVGVFLAALLVLRPVIRRQSEGLRNRNQSLRQLFHLPLICSAALLSFAHGANDVANAVGPLAGILHTLESGGVSGSVQLPLWVMLIGAAGISVGLFLFGPKLIRTVGEQITRMNPMRAFCVALSAAITVIVASALGLPVSSTHIAVGAVFGVGFFREYYTTHSRHRRAYMARKLGTGSPDQVRLKRSVDVNDLVRRKLVRRSHFTVIIAAWVVTGPAAAAISAAVYWLISTLTM